MDSLKNSDFKRVYSKGKSLASRYLVLYYYPNNLDKNRIGFSISKRVGKAVVRNKLRRRLKEIIRLTDNIKSGYDLVFIGRKPSVSLDYHDLKKDVHQLLKRARLLGRRCLL
ncbi:ribonuclease P protein component [Halothermothrix orenii]|uniref:ribonuclease P protein component n=1 Tax=Halothermothrix orenii TaxID=31909 RepID=UPI0002D2B324|nr:ribonuclease P protein component [Halothermothrix orenii]